ncbi:sigma-70 family RNA polymerase sigma factor [Singulisphaera sp. PoT]|uniref:sigma-70 family RNA polymerase sigma factor n=1 Tax=Singulisphaera sp. PoT TaxID=3411797 RepID=UPI003BF4FB42
MLATQEARIGATKKGGAPDSTPPTNESTGDQIIAQENVEASPGLTRAQQALCEAHYKRARRIGRAFARKYPQFNIDWRGAVHEGLVQAARTYRPDKGASFETYSRQRVEGSCFDFMRRERLKGYGRSRGYEGAPKLWRLEEAEWLLSGTRKVLGARRPLLKALTSDEPPVGSAIEAEESAEEVRRLTRCLRRREREIIRRYYIGDRPTFAELGRDLGLCESRVCQLHSAGLEELRHEIEAGKGRAA